jgi:hypothetical protein
MNNGTVTQFGGFETTFFVLDLDLDLVLDPNPTLLLLIRSLNGFFSTNFFSFILKGI